MSTILLNRRRELMTVNAQTPVEETKVVGIVEVESTSTPYYFGLVSDLSNSVSSMEIDGVEQSGLIDEYTFSTLGEHIVKFTLIDPTTIRSRTFDDTQFSRIIIPNSVVKVGDNSSGYCFASNADLYDIVFGNNVQFIEILAFEGCRGLQSINIPDSIKEIGVQSFSNCSSLNNVTIGSGIEEIGNSAFNTIANNASITIKAITPPVLGGNTVFKNRRTGTIYVPSGSVNAYKTAQYWTTWAGIIRPIP